jgi:hypothetical protein
MLLPSLPATEKTSDRTSHLIRCCGQNNSEDALLSNKMCSSVVVDLQNHPNINGAVCSTEKHFCFSEVSIPNMEKKQEGITFHHIFKLVKF